jgi:quinol monooxygenase YgiN
MVTVVAKLKVHAGKEADFERAARVMIEHVKSAEQSTLTYVLHRARKDPTTFLFYERYTDRAGLDAHSQSPQMATMFSAIGSMLDGPPQIEMYEEIDGKR